MECTINFTFDPKNPKEAKVVSDFFSLISGRKQVSDSISKALENSGITQEDFNKAVESLPIDKAQEIALSGKPAVEVVKDFGVVLPEGGYQEDELVEEAVRILREEGLIDEKNPPTGDPAAMSIDSLGLSTRAYNALTEKNGITQIEDLLAIEYADLAKLDGVGKGSQEDIFNRLQAHGYVETEADMGVKNATQETSDDVWMDDHLLEQDPWNDAESSPETSEEQRISELLDSIQEEQRISGLLDSLQDEQLNAPEVLDQMPATQAGLDASIGVLAYDSETTVKFQKTNVSQKSGLDLEDPENFATAISFARSLLRVPESYWMEAEDLCTELACDLEMKFRFEANKSTDLAKMGDFEAFMASLRKQVNDIPA